MRFPFTLPTEREFDAVGFGLNAVDHLVVVPEAFVDDLLKTVRPKRASRIGGFPAQHLEFYWISPEMEHMQHGAMAPKR